MTFEYLLEQARAAGFGFVLGVVTAAWVHAIWLRMHPHTIRFWGTWYTDPRVLVVTGIVLVVAWVGLIVSS